MSIDDFLDEQYDATKNNCGHFVVKVWKYLTNKNISGTCAAFMSGDLSDYKAQRKKELTHIREPVSPCVVMMQSPHSETHVGIYVFGKVLHLREEGVKYEPLKMLEPYWRMSYYK